MLPYQGGLARGGPVAFSLLSTPAELAVLDWVSSALFQYMQAVLSCVWSLKPEAITEGLGVLRGPLCQPLLCYHSNVNCSFTFLPFVLHFLLIPFLSNIRLPVLFCFFFFFQ